MAIFFSADSSFGDGGSHSLPGHDDHVFPFLIRGLPHLESSPATGSLPVKCWWGHDSTAKGDDAGRRIRSIEDLPRPGAPRRFSPWGASGNDHGGYELKLQIVEHLKDAGLDILDAGSDSAEIVRYPCYAAKVAGAVSRGRCPAAF